MWRLAQTLRSSVPWPVQCLSQHAAVLILQYQPPAREPHQHRAVGEETDAEYRTGHRQGYHLSRERVHDGEALEMPARVGTRPAHLDIPTVGGDTAIRRSDAIHPVANMCRA